jgi:hypothetical protein
MPNQEGSSFGHSLIRCTGDSTASGGSLVDAVEHAEMVEKELNAFIQRRSRKGEVELDEQEELWKESVRRYNDRKEAELRAAWCQHHQEQAARLKAVLEGLISRHEAEAERYLAKGA